MTIEIYVWYSAEIEFVFHCILYSLHVKICRMLYERFDWSYDFFHMADIFLPQNVTPVRRLMLTWSPILSTP